MMNHGNAPLPQPQLNQTESLLIHDAEVQRTTQKRRVQSKLQTGPNTVAKENERDQFSVSKMDDSSEHRGTFAADRDFTTHQEQ